MMYFVEVPKDATLEAKQKIADLLQSLGVSPGPYVPMSPMGTGMAATWFEVADEDVDVVIGGLNAKGMTVLNVADVRGAGQPQGGSPQSQGAPTQGAPRPAGAPPSGPPPGRAPVPTVPVASLVHMIPPPIPGGGGRVRNTPMPAPIAAEPVVELVDEVVEVVEPPPAPAPAPVDPEVVEEPLPGPPPEVHAVLLPPSRWSLKDADAIQAELAYVRGLDNDDDLQASQHGQGARIRLGVHLGTARWQQSDGAYSLTIHPDMAASDEGEFIGDGFSWVEMLEALQAYVLDAVGTFNNRIARSKETADKRRRRKAAEPVAPAEPVVPTES